MNEVYKSTVFILPIITKNLPKSFFILTAFNPMDELLERRKNVKNNFLLLSELNQFTNHIIPMIGCSPDIQHKEESFIVKISKDQTLKIAKRFRQRAVFFIYDDNLSILECSTQSNFPLGKFSDRVINKPVA